MQTARRIWDTVYELGGSCLTDPRDCSVYMMVNSQGEIIVIDCGAGPSAPSILQLVKATGFDPMKVKALVLTHGHIDHIGGARHLKEKTGCSIIAHARDTDAIEGRNPTRTAASWYGIEYRAVTVDDEIRGELESRRFGDIELHLLHTPGHTPGSMVVYSDRQSKRILFGQDIHGPFDEAFGSDVDVWRKSMAKVKGLNADILCEGHFGVYDGMDKVRNYIDHYLESV